MPTRKDAAALLAERLLHALQGQRCQGGDGYPLTLGRLGELAAPDATAAQLLKAAGKKAFRAGAAVLRSRTVHSPLALTADGELLAASDLAILFVLGSARTASNQAFSVAQLKAKVSEKWRRPFQAAVQRRLEDGSLPATVGWITIHRSKHLFLLSDLRRGGERPSTPPGQRAGAAAAPPSAALPPETGQAAASTADVATALDDAFRQLDRQAGSHNFVSLVDLRRAVRLPREVFDAELRRLRLAGRYSLSAAEGRHGTSPVEREAGIMEDGTLLLYVSLKSP